MYFDLKFDWHIFRLLGAVRFDKTKYRTEKENAWSLHVSFWRPRINSLITRHDVTYFFVCLWKEGEGRFLLSRP